MNEALKLIMSSEALQTAISNYEARKAAMENTYLKISNEVRVLDGAWDGEASEKFKTSYDNLYKNISKTETVMSNIIANLKEALAEYTEASEEAKSLASNLDVGQAYHSQMT